jgi:diguanylate cyclase (GGDEF)-like protein/PAS domain S-box-containing protein
MPLELVTGAGWMERVHPADLPATRESWDASVASGEPFDHEYRVRLRSGIYHWFRARAAARRDPHGQIVRWYGTLEHIHDRKLAEAALRESEAFSRSILENSPNSIRVLDLDGRLLYMNATALRMLEIEDGESLGGELWANMIPPAYRADAHAALAVAKAGGNGSFTIRRQRRDGTEQWLETVTGLIPGEEGSPARLLAISADATEARQAREAVQHAQRDVEQLAARLSAVLESTLDSVIVLDRAWCLTYFNGNAAHALRARQAVLGRCIWDMFPEDVDGVFARHFHRSLEQQTPVAFEEYMPGLNAWLEVNACPTADGISIFFRDVTKRRRAEQERLVAQEKMAHMARHDVLTGVPNTLLFRERLEHTLHDSRDGAMAAVLCLDLDGFKAVNDTFGHPAGDAVLRQVAERLRNCVRGSDTVARLGGDEFAIVQADIGGAEEAGGLARRIVQALSRPMQLDGERVVVGASVGVALAPKDGATADELLRAADIALYRAKAEGTGTHRFFEPGMDEQLRERLAVRRSLHEALAHQQFELHYQPLYDLNSGRISCFEALMRWRHPGLGLVSPADFIPIAEETGLIVAIGEWALHEACRQATAWPASIGVAVNLSPIQFRGGKLVDIVSRALSACGLEPSRLQLEITESVMLQEDSSNLAILQELRRLGIRIAMDDFGTGYSSLSYLRSFPFDKIKLDRSFVNDVRSGSEARAILHAVAGLGAGFNILTAAEGIETPSQLAAVRDEGFDEGQGYLFSPPVTAQQALELIRADEAGDSPLAQARDGQAPAPGE